MKITVIPVGIVKRYVEKRDLEVEPGFTSGELIEKLGLPPKLKMVSFVNGKRKDPDHALGDGDHVRLVTLMTGG